MSVPDRIQRKADEELLRLAQDAEDVMGSDDLPGRHHCRRGTWLFVGAAVAAAAMGLLRLNPWLVGGLMLAAGYVLNELEARRLKARIAAERAGLQKT